MKTFSYAVRGAAVVAALAVATVAYAGPRGGMWQGNAPGVETGMGYGHGHGMRMHHGGDGMGMATECGMGHGGGPGAGGGYSAFADGRLAYLKSALKITPAQEPQWEAFTATWKGHVESMEANRERAWQGAAPDRMARHAEAMQKGAAEMAVVSKAFGELYAVLTAEQKTVADRYFAMGSPRAGLSPRRGG
jgi:hypothetical protein